MDLLAARMGGGFLKEPAPEPKPTRSYRIHVPLNFEDVTQNAFDYAALVKKEKEKEGLPDLARSLAPSPGGSVNGAHSGASSDDEHEASDSDRRPVCIYVVMGLRTLSSFSTFCGYIVFFWL